MWFAAVKRMNAGGTLPADHSGGRAGQRQSVEEETFGPLAPLFRFKDEADVIAQANDTEFGLAAYFYARYLSRASGVGESAGVRHRRHQYRHYFQ